MNKEKWCNKFKLPLIIGAVLLLIILIFFGTQLALMFNLILGNDILIKLSSDKEHLSLKNSQSAAVQFQASVTTNPFCAANCTAKFVDLSRDKVLDQQKFEISPGVPYTKEYTITAPDGVGLDLYRFQIQCHSQETILCHTQEEPITRIILITAAYHLNESQELLKQERAEEFQQQTLLLTRAKAIQQALQETIAAVNNSLILPFTFVTLEPGEEELQTNKGLWETYHYMEMQFFPIPNMLEQYQNMAITIDQYNNLSRKVAIANIFLHQSIPWGFGNSSIQDKFQEFLNRSTLERKEDIAASILEEHAKVQREALTKALESTITATLICQLSGECPEPGTINDTAANICNFTARTENILNVTQQAWQERYLEQNYSFTLEFNQNVQDYIHNLREGVKAELRRNWTASILDPLPLQPVTSTYNLTPAAIMGLELKACTISNETISVLSYPLLEISSISLIIPNISLEEPAPLCCVGGECQMCCTAKSCQEDPSLYPVLFIHGHAISGDVAADYSLEGFQQIQDRLEEDGYVNAGAITLYTSRDIPAGEWGKPKAPFTLRGSYYFDFFEDENNYVVVPTKSENIDTYAVRMKEIIETIKYNTGKPKVKIVAFSMGGLVTRRYLQIFGVENVEKVVLIAVPNHGIVGDVVEYCPLIGEKRECEDMNAESVFIKKLNQGRLPAIPIYNIVATGCEMDNGIGDGAVLERSAILPGAENFVINGTCPSTVNPLHVEIRNIGKYPEVYEIVKEGLE